jgi:hypothetical protein
MRALHYLAVLAVAATRATAGQQLQSSIAISGGSATDLRGTTSRALSLTPSLAYVGAPGGAYALTGGVTRFDNQQWAASLDGAAAFRASPAKLVTSMLRVAAGGVTTSYGVAYATTSFLPEIDVGTDALAGYVGLRGSLAATTHPASPSATPGVFGQPLANASKSVQESGAAATAMVGTRLRLLAQADEWALVDFREERGSINGTPTADHTVSFSMTEGRASLGATAGLRQERQSSTGFGSAALSLAMSGSAALELSGGTYPVNRLLGTAAGRFLNVGVSLRRSSVPARLLQPDNAPALIMGATRLVFRAPDATSIEVSGDFTNWKPIMMRQASNGVWYLDLKISPGQYRYAFREDGREWRVPEGVATVDDGFGGKSAWLIVSAPGTTAR